MHKVIFHRFQERVTEDPRTEGRKEVMADEECFMFGRTTFYVRQEFEGKKTYRTPSLILTAIFPMNIVALVRIGASTSFCMLQTTLTNRS